VDDPATNPSVHLHFTTVPQKFGGTVRRPPGQHRRHKKSKQYRQEKAAAFPRISKLGLGFSACYIPFEADLEINHLMACAKNDEARPGLYSIRATCILFFILAYSALTLGNSSYFLSCLFRPNKQRGIYVSQRHVQTGEHRLLR